MSISGTSLFTVMGIGALVLAACSPAAAPTAAPTATPTAAPLATAPSSKATPGATPTVSSPPAPTTQPTATPRPTPTSAPVAQAKPKAGGTLLAMQSGDPPGWDFMVLSGGQSLMRMQNNLVFSQLLAVPNGPETGCSVATRNELAESWRWLDDLNLEVKVRTGVRFHNKPPVQGREMTVEDVVYSIQRFLKVQARAAAVAKIVKSVEAAGPNTVLISLDQPHGGLPDLSLLGSHYGAAILAREAGGPKESWDNPSTSYIGTGPFMFRQYLPGVKITYDRNPDYWKKGLPYVDAMEWKLVPDRATQGAIMRAKKVDVQPQGVGLATVNELRATAPDVRIQSCPAFAVAMTYLRTDQPPLNDVRVRRALSMAIDRNSILANLLKGEGQVGALMPPIHPLYLAPKDVPPEIRRFVEYHPDDAKRLLAEAGYPEGKGLEVTINHTLGRHVRFWEEWTEVMISSFQEMGIKVKPNWMEYGLYSRTVLSGDYAGLATTGFVPSDMYVKFSDFWSQAQYAQNRSHVNDPEMDTLVLEFIRTTDPNKQKDLARRLQLRAIEQAYMIAPPANMDYYLSQPWVKNFGPVPFDPFTGTWAEITWLDK